MAYRTSIGLDVHARSISACALANITGEITQRSFSQPIAQDIIGWASGFEGPVRAVYETGPTGFALARQLNASGLECVVGATSKMLRPSGDRVKNDRRDALLLARMLSTGNIPEVAIPDAEQEAAKDLVRMREDAREALTASKLRLAHFLIRKGHVYEKGKKTWTRAYEDWLRGLNFDTELDKTVFDEHLAKVRADMDRRNRIQKLVEEEAGSERWSPMVARLSCMKGISTYTAFALAVEIGDFGRFPNARAFQSYVGLLATENSSGEKVRSGGITKTGNCLRQEAPDGGVLALPEAEDAEPFHIRRGGEPRSNRARPEGMHTAEEASAAFASAREEGVRRGHRDIPRARGMGLGARDDVAVTPGRASSSQGIRLAAIGSPKGPRTILDFSDYLKRKIVIAASTREYKTLN